MKALIAKVSAWFARRRQRKIALANQRRMTAAMANEGYEVQLDPGGAQCAPGPERMNWETPPIPSVTKLIEERKAAA